MSHAFYLYVCVSHCNEEEQTELLSGVLRWKVISYAIYISVRNVWQRRRYVLLIPSICVLQSFVDSISLKIIELRLIDYV